MKGRESAGEEEGRNDWDERVGRKYGRCSKGRKIRRWKGRDGSKELTRNK